MLHSLWAYISFMNGLMMHTVFSVQRACAVNIDIFFFGLSLTLKKMEEDSFYKMKFCTVFSVVNEIQFITTALEQTPTNGGPGEKTPHTCKLKVLLISKSVRWWLLLLCFFFFKIFLPCLIFISLFSGYGNEFDTNENKNINWLKKFKSKTNLNLNSLTLPLYPPSLSLPTFS